MKMIFRSIKILFACLAIYCFSPSCKSSSKFTSKSSGTLLVAPIKIYYDASELTLVLQQNGHDANYVQVNQNQPVMWDAQTSGLEIFKISADSDWVSSNDPNFFLTRPAPISEGNTKLWKATITSHRDSSKPFLKYYIKYKINGDATIYTFDPIMQIR